MPSMAGCGAISKDVFYRRLVATSILSNNSSNSVGIRLGTRLASLLPVARNTNTSTDLP